MNTSQITKNSDGLVLAQSFDGKYMDWSQSSAEARDASGNANHGDVVGATTAIGKRGQALSFDGVDDYVSLADSDSLRDLPNTALSFLAWVKKNDSGTNTYLFSKATGSATNGWYFWVDEFRRANFTIKRATTNLNVSSSTNILPVYANGWFYIAVTYPGGDEASNIHIYVNGVEVSSYMIQTDGVGNYQTDNSLTARIGRSNYNNYISGQIDEVRVYNRALSAEEIGDLYRLGEVKILE